MPTAVRSALIGAFSGLLVVFLLAMALFVYVMYDGHVSRESLIEAGNFAAQTVTTVGYGNWETPAITPLVSMPNAELRRLHMRGYSIAFMILGATFYAAFTGVIVAALIPPN